MALCFTAPPNYTGGGSRSSLLQEVCCKITQRMCTKKVPDIVKSARSPVRLTGSGGRLSGGCRGRERWWRPLPTLQRLPQLLGVAPSCCTPHCTPGSQVSAVVVRREMEEGLDVRSRRWAYRRDPTPGWEWVERRMLTARSPGPPGQRCGRCAPRSRCRNWSFRTRGDARRNPRP